MILVGDKQLVALELSDDAPLGFCGTRLWLAGVPLGEPELYVTIGELAAGLANVRTKAEGWIQPSLFNQSAETCLNLIHDAVFSSAGERDSATEVDDRYDDCLLSPNLCECLDAYLIVVVSNGSDQRILARNSSDGVITEARVPEGTLEQVFEAAENELRELEERKR